MNQEKRPVTLEDLLRLKRVERPQPEFWSEFDRELRTKQLAALVEKSPWWRGGVSRVLAVWSRYHLPIGASAALAITFVAVRSYHSPADSTMRASAVQPAPAAVSSGALATAELAPLQSSTALAREATAPDSTAADISSATLQPTATMATLAPGEISRLIAGDEQLVSKDVTPSRRHIEANLAAAAAAGSVGNSRLLVPTSGFESRVMPARAAEPLAKMNSPAAARSARLLSAMAVSFSSETPLRSNENVARRLSDDQLYDSGVHRFGAKANSLTLKL
jgi:hypothetical protein